MRKRRFEPKGTQKLSTERLLLCRFNDTHAQMMFDNWASDAEVTRYLRWQPHENVSWTEKIIAEWCENYADNNFYQWAIVIKNSGEVIGSISLFDVDSLCRRATIGYCISRAYWGRGITAEALECVMKFAFCEVGFLSLHSCHAVQNPNSGRVMQKCGMKQIGYRPRGEVCCYGIVDAVDYEITARDYFDRH